MATEEKDVLRLFTTYAAAIGSSKRRQRVYATDTKQLIQHNNSDDTIASEWSDDTLQCLLASAQTLTGQKTFNEKILFPNDNSIGDNSGVFEIKSDDVYGMLIDSYSDIEFNVDSGDIILGDNITIKGEASTGEEVLMQPNAQFKAAASVASKSGFALQEGVAPTVPDDGEIWLTTTDLIARVNGVSESLLANSSTHVLIAGVQTVTGAKTFSAALTCEDDLVVDTDTLFVDASEDKVAIGTTAPDGLLHLHQGSAGAVTSTSMLTLENNGDAEMQFLAPAANKMLINFGDASATNIGHIEYDNNGDTMGFRVAGSERMSIDSAGVTLTGKLVLPNSHEIYDNSGVLTIADGNIWGIKLDSYGDVDIETDSGDVTVAPTGGDVVLNPSGSGKVDCQSDIDIASGSVIKVNGTQVLGAQGAALTAQLTDITHTAPGTPDYAIQNLTNSSPYGFVSQDEGNTILSVIANLQTRVGELESRLEAHGIIAS